MISGDCIRRYPRSRALLLALGVPCASSGEKREENYNSLNASCVWIICIVLTQRLAETARVLYSEIVYLQVIPAHAFLGIREVFRRWRCRRHERFCAAIHFISKANAIISLASFLTLKQSLIDYSINPRRHLSIAHSLLLAFSEVNSTFQTRRDEDGDISL